MKKMFRKSTAILLVLVQLLVLCPFGMMQAQAAEAQAASAAVPAINKTVVGTVKFQSFNFLGDNANGIDGTDYSSTFYYSDDYFSPSAINSSADKREMLWSDLDNKALASCSMDFAVAAMTSAKGDVVNPTSRTWENSVYDSAIKEKNVRDFLGACGFSGIECTELDKRPRNDSIGYTLASKQITVWDETDRANKTYTLVAVGIRGAGYGQEWASNVTIGNPETGAIPANGRHYGFDSSAVKVCDAIQTYLGEHNITGNVKYWITGFSRAAAVANLAAGYLTDDAEEYRTRQQDVYAYTWECPKAARKTDSPDTNFTNYKNIHNILNPMDAVPKVSPDKFEHQRLGVDYQMPYHGNVTSTAQNTALYNQMYEVLKTIATGCEYTGKTDPLIETVNPSNYPYRNPITIYRVNGTTLLEQALAYAVSSDKENAQLLKEFGTEVAEQKHEERYGPFNLLTRTVGNADHLLGWVDGMDYKTTTWYLDDFVDGLIDVFLTSKAWVGDIGPGRSAMENRATFISQYQPYFRTLFGYFLDYAGPAFLDLVPNLVDAVTGNIGSSLLTGFPAAFLAFYAAPTNNTLRRAAANSAKSVMHNVIDSLTEDFPDPEYQGITKAKAENAMDQLVPLVFDLYAYELQYFNSQYLGTTLRYLNTILCTHEQETVMSWIKSLDQNHINRGYRTLTVPKGTDVKMYLCRGEYGETLNFDTTAPLVAETKNAAFVPVADANGTQQQTLDDRISVTASGSNMVIRYPSLLDLRFDVTTETEIPDLAFALSDYRTNAMTTALSDGEKQYDPARFTASNYASFTSSGASTWNAVSNSNTIPLAPTETLSITARHTESYNENDTSSNLFYNMRKHVDTARVIDFSAVTTVATDAQALSGETNTHGQFLRNATAKTVTYQLNSGALSSGAAVLSSPLAEADTAAVTHTSIGRLTQDESLTVVPASSIYFDDDLSGQTFTSDGHGYSPDLNDAAVSKSASAVSGTFYFTFYGTGIDAYCTTDGESGYVSAAVFRGAGAEACVKANRVGSAVTVSNKSADVDHPRYNTPTISFMNLGEQGTYTLKIAANDNAKFKLDGVRVYNPVQANSAAAEAQAAAGEGGALYLNLRDLLLNAGQDFSVQPVAGMDSAFDKSTISGVLFLDDADAIVSESHYDADGVWHEEMTQLYATQFDAYKANSPKSEIYLSDGQAITFQVNTAKAPVGSTIYIGMSAPETGDGEVLVTGNADRPVTSVMDMYYGVTVPANGIITVTNVGGSLISLTNLKLLNVADAGSIQAMPAPERNLVMRAFFAPMTTETIALAAQSGEPAAPEETEAPAPTPEATPEPTPTVTPEPTPTVTPEPTAEASDTISQLLSGFIRSLFGGISRLFGKG